MATADPVESLIFDLLDSLRQQPRARSEVIDAWRTSCPRLPVWEEANARGFIEQRQEQGGAVLIALTSKGAEYLRQRKSVLPG